MTLRIALAKVNTPAANCYLVDIQGETQPLTATFPSQSKSVKMSIEASRSYSKNKKLAVPSHYEAYSNGM